MRWEYMYQLVFMLKLAKLHKLPVVIHVRESFNEVYSIVKEEQDGTLNGVFHCFTGNETEARQIVDLGFLLGIGGVVTFKNSDLSKVLKPFAVQNLVLETDAPYLSPVPYRGKRNECAYLINIATKISEIKMLSIQEVAQTTTANALNVFGTHIKK